MNNFAVIIMKTRFFFRFDKFSIKQKDTQTTVMFQRLVLYASKNKISFDSMYLICKDDVGDDIGGTKFGEIFPFE